MSSYLPLGGLGSGLGRPAGLAGLTHQSRMMPQIPGIVTTQYDVDRGEALTIIAVLIPQGCF